MDDRKRDARARFEQRKRLDRRWRRAPETPPATRGTSDASTTATRWRRDGDATAPRAPHGDVDVPDDRATARGADLDELLRDAAMQCLPRRRADATRVDASWNADALEDAARPFPRDAHAATSTSTSTSTVARDITEAVTLDRDETRAHLRSLGLARLLGLSDEYDEFVDGDVQGATDDVGARARARERIPVVAPTVSSKPVVVDDDDWLDELLDGD